MFVSGLRCTLCADVLPKTSAAFTCPRCGPLGILEVEFDYAAIAPLINRRALAADPRLDLVRYRPLLPLPEHAPWPTLSLTRTPLYDAPRLAQAIGVARLWVKDEGRMPTASMKDRASFVGVSRALAEGAAAIACASTGNAATSLAGLAASAGLPSFIFVPARAPEAKIAQLLAYGATVFQVEADYDRTYALCQEAVTRFGFYDRSAARNPYLVEGKKTLGLELAEQLQAEGGADWIAMAVGDGCSIAGTYKGLFEMFRLGVIDRVPKMLAVQAEGAAPLAAAFARESEAVAMLEAQTLADSINVGAPKNPLKALRAVRASNGTFVTVSDAAILAALPELARHTGVFAEPTGSAALAGIHVARARGLIAAHETVVHVATGHGLKDPRGVLAAVARPASIPADLAAVEAVLAGAKQSPATNA